MSAKTSTATETGTTRAPAAPRGMSSVSDVHLVRVGKRKKKHIKKLKMGHGRLATDIQQIVSQKMARLPDPPEGQEYQPVVVVYREVMSKKAKKKRKKKQRKKNRKQFGMLGLGKNSGLKF